MPIKSFYSVVHKKYLLPGSDVASSGSKCRQVREGAEENSWGWVPVIREHYMYKI